MSVFMIGYDLHEGEDYEDLIDAIKGLTNSRWHFLDSTWFIVSDSDAVTIRDTLKSHLRSPDNANGDKLLVVQTTTPTNRACTGAFSDNCRSWLKEYL
jgi:hypothetical protein